MGHGLDTVSEWRVDSRLLLSSIRHVLCTCTAPSAEHVGRYWMHSYDCRLSE